MKRRALVVLVIVAGLVAASCGRSDKKATGGTSGSTTTAAATAADKCTSTPLQATEVGVSPTEITVEVMADIGSPLAPGLFQGNVDALNAYATYVNAHGGIGCRKLVVKTWDSQLKADESKNGIIDACKNAVAMVGGNSLFNPDVSLYNSCPDKAGAATGLPDLAALANDINEQCNWAVTFLIQGVSEHCPITPGQPRPLSGVVGPSKYYLNKVPGLHGLYLVPGDLPTTRQSATYLIKAAEDAGIKWDAKLLVGGRDEQSAYTPRIQALKANGSNFVYNGSNDQAMIKIRKEAKAQGVDSVKIWACSLACYTRNMLTQGGADVEGTYVWMQFLPFEEADTNAEAKAYVDSVGANKVDSFGANAWQAAVLFKQVIDQIVQTDGPNAITRAKMLEVLKGTKDFSANGWLGPKDLHGFSTCQVIMQVQAGKFVRVFPQERGKMDCNPANIVTVNLDPVAEAAKLK
ncbi:MAG: hypothetical protein JWO37_1995 [Acidimicrobiales bacterium]|jgi:hypothetical protein|nr:hypothetical protein [Acidimicrobiales bacterium]